MLPPFQNRQICNDLGNECFGADADAVTGSIEDALLRGGLWVQPAVRMTTHMMTPEGRNQDKELI